MAPFKGIIPSNSWPFYTPIFGLSIAILCISQALVNPEQGMRLLDGVVVLGTPTGTAKAHEIEIRNRDIVIIQTKAQRLGMYLLGQALFSKHLMAAFKPKSIETVAVCTKGDAVLEPIALQYGIKVVVYPVRSR